MIVILESGIEMVRKGDKTAQACVVMIQIPIAASKSGDAKFRLEKYLADVVGLYPP